MKRPFETVRETYFNNLESLKENQRYNFSNLDKLMIWLIGFSIGGFSIIVANITQLNQTFSHGLLKTILILLVISIVLGIIYRIVFYLYQVEYQKIEFYLQGAFSNNEMMAFEPEDLSEENDINVILHSLKFDYGDDCLGVLEEYNKASVSDKEIIIKSLKEHYKKVSEFVKKEYEFSENYVKNVFHEAFGISEKQIEKIMKSSSSKAFKAYAWITFFTFILSCLSFIVALIILCVNF